MMIPIKIPSLLMHCTNDQNVVEIEAETLSAALENLMVDYPLLKTHLYDGKGTQREHVLFFFNKENIEWLENQDISLKMGDQITILQAVSGG